MTYLFSVRGDVFLDKYFDKIFSKCFVFAKFNFLFRGIYEKPNTFP